MFEKMLSSFQLIFCMKLTTKNYQIGDCKLRPQDIGFHIYYTCLIFLKHFSVEHYQFTKTKNEQS